MQRRPWLRACVWLAFLGPFFFLTYGFANQMAVQQDALGKVGNIALAWERHIPLWPWTIVPYWSIDLLYAISPFLCRSRTELDRHGLRLLCAQLIAVTCFLLWPLAFGFTRPPIEGVFGQMFSALDSFDKPYNQAPSLHIVLLVVLWVKYAQYLHGIWRLLLHIWFALIGLSVLTTWQHHFLDVPTGLAVGWLCVWLWPDAPLASPLQRAAPAHCSRWRFALLYALGAALLCGLAWQGGFWLCLAWPALSLAVVAFNYAWSGAAGFQKQANGQLSIASRWLLAPYLAAAWLNSRLWTHRQPQPVALGEGLWLGRIPGRGERQNFAQVFDCCAELPRMDARPGDAQQPMLDLLPPTKAQLIAAADALDKQLQQGPVLLCCALGYSRSASVTLAWRIRYRGASVAEALQWLQQRKPECVIKPAHRHVLERL
ncbi:serine/threonine protein phosphatase [Lysobacteraceae bacterium NML75-0749]|nr:serine/threonine protein phosphatase [Xanthomonadaceae bacterium NML75-0749]PJK05403.1 serine/threonine protein phosphatase [Xanthomonadaceae bacterium NML91-0268]